MKRTVLFLVLAVLMLNFIMPAYAVKPAGKSFADTFLEKDSLWYADADRFNPPGEYLSDWAQGYPWYLSVEDGQVYLYWPNDSTIPPVALTETNHTYINSGIRFTGNVRPGGSIVVVYFGEDSMQLSADGDGVTAEFKLQSGETLYVDFERSKYTSVSALPAAGSVPDLSVDGAWYPDATSVAGDEIRYNFTSWIPNLYLEAVLNCKGLSLLIEDGRIYMQTYLVERDSYVRQPSIMMNRLLMPVDKYVNGKKFYYYDRLPRCTFNNTHYRIGQPRVTEQGLEVTFPALEIALTPLEDIWEVALAADPWRSTGEGTSFYTIPEMTLLITQQQDGSLSVVCKDAPGIGAVTFRPGMHYAVEATYYGRELHLEENLFKVFNGMSASFDDKGKMTIRVGKKSYKVDLPVYNGTYYAFVTDPKPEKSSYIKGVKSKYYMTSFDVMTGTDVRAASYVIEAEGIRGKIVSQTIDEVTGFLTIETDKGLVYRCEYAPFEVGTLYGNRSAEVKINKNVYNISISLNRFRVYHIVKGNYEEGDAFVIE